MAQTRRRRQTKHRGDATGAVVTRGRTGGKAAAAQRGRSGRRDSRAREARAERYNRPPTWKGAAARALIASLIVAVAGVLLIRSSVTQAVVYFPVVFLIYLPLSYYTDLWLYRRRLRKSAAGGDRGSGGAERNGTGGGR